VFVLAPQFLYLVLGASLLLVGFVAIFRRRPRPVKVATAAARRDAKADKLEVVTVRLGVFGVLYTVPTICVVASVFYEYWWRDEWLLVTSVSRYQPRPSLWIFLLRLFMSLVVGITAAVWVWSPKTLRAWRRLFHRFGPYKQPPVKCHPIQYYAPPPLASSQQRSQHGHKPHRKHRKHGSETTV
jgi:frizzled protein 4